MSRLYLHPTAAVNAVKKAAESAIAAYTLDLSITMDGGLKREKHKCPSILSCFGSRAAAQTEKETEVLRALRLTMTSPFVDRAEVRATDG